MLYLDNGPVAKSHVFQNVMSALHIDWQTHIPAGKVERPFCNASQHNICNSVAKNRYYST